MKNLPQKTPRRGVRVGVNICGAVMVSSLPPSRPSPARGEGARAPGGGSDRSALASPTVLRLVGGRWGRPWTVALAKKLLDLLDDLVPMLDVGIGHALIIGRF